eukprot:7215783-Prymnesium_polylepis.1
MCAHGAFNPDTIYIYRGSGPGGALSGNVPQTPKSEDLFFFTSGCHAVNDFLIQFFCPRRSPGPLRMLHAKPWVVVQGDVERADGS